jgi:hypothetical protein
MTMSESAGERVLRQARERFDLLWDRGMDEGYPLCCISAFVTDVAGGRHPAQLRPLSKLDGRVLCEYCMVAEAEAEIRRSQAT